MSNELDQAYEHCRQIAKAQARNFYYAFRTLPGRKRRAIYATYAFCRVCDDIADEEAPTDEKQRRLGEVRALLSGGSDGLPHDPIFEALAGAAEEFNIPASYFAEIVDGVEMDLTKTRFADFEELRDYCYKVASAVGLICIEVFGYKGPNAREYAVDMGLAMQLTNILRDVREDGERGRIYLPQDEMAEFGYTEAELLAGVVNEPFRNLMAFQAERARGYFNSGKLLIPLLSPRSRACLWVLHGLYSKILDRIEASGFEVFRERVSLSGTEKLFLTARLWAQSLIPVARPTRP